MKKFTWMLLVWVMLTNGKVLEFPSAKGWYVYEGDELFGGAKPFMALYDIPQSEAISLLKKDDKTELNKHKLAVFQYEKVIGHGLVPYIEKK